MRSRRSVRVPVVASASAVLAAALLTPSVATAAPTCTISGTEGLCGGRVVAEPELSTTFLQFGTEFENALRAIEAVDPDHIDVFSLAELTGDPSHVSTGGRTIWVARYTDESVPQAGKKQAVVSLSVHGTEPAGHEGGIRYLEDLARWNAADPATTLHGGDVAVPMNELFREVELWFGWVNPDGWAAGDFTDPEFVIFNRGNSNGVDLNREFPTVGWTARDHTPLSETESQGWDAFVAALPNLATASDIHGELTTATDALVDLMWPAGQWDAYQQAQELRLAKSITATVEKKFDDYGIVMTDLNAALGLSGSGVATKPANFATAYDVVGYDDSGFMGDWFIRRGAVEIDAEIWLSHLVPANTWNGVLEQAHAAGVRGIIEAVAVEATQTENVFVDLDLGDIAFISDAVTVRSDDADLFGFDLLDGEEPLAYDADRMQYFRDLAPFTDNRMDELSPFDVATGAVDLSTYDSIVLADDIEPVDPQGRAYPASALATALDAFARGGGQLVLTDGAVPLLVDLEIFEPGDSHRILTNAGHIDFGAFEHPWEAKVEGIASQTYYEVPLGFLADDSAPHFGIEQSAWEAAGGTTAGTVRGAGNDGITVTVSALGDLPHGDGVIAAFGAVLPTATEANPHLYGLSHYGVTVAGGQVLHQILAHRNAAATEPAPAPTVEPTTTTDPSPEPLPATGGGAALAALATLALAARLRRP